LIFETGALAYAANMTITLLERDTGTAKMQRVAGFIQEGAQGFFRTQFFAIISMAVVMCGLLFVGFLFRPKDPNVKVSPFTLAIITCVSFSVGATCSCLAGFVGLWISVRTNVRVASAARRSYVEAIQTGKYFKRKSEHREMEITVFDISIPPSSFKPIALFLSRSPLF
jgi:Na+/H+-translocating membrane pyrophosphatase